ncbi:hypothetical protein CCR75_003504 [Bremia lactucae]|uniref:Uncharacterized protein n=1 Tax=Bremia lactucae TaxID=4779 RepID=A0A976IGT4_BRELC|nr:hypothetical protein CCR75_003504 [Bremia lactucae]
MNDDKSSHFLSSSYPNGKCALLDEKRVPTPQEKSDLSTLNPKKRPRRVVDSSTTCVPEQRHCRYANKRCLHPRAVKRTGGLHTFCAMHRANANRNQRRLDMRKRMARQALKVEATYLHSHSSTVTLKQQHNVLQNTTAQSPRRNFDTNFEPFYEPTPLQEEDIATLVMLFLPRQGATFEREFGTSLVLATPNEWVPTESSGSNDHILPSSRI